MRLSPFMPPDPQSLIKQLDGFGDLPRAYQDMLLNWPGNFMGLPREWNSSKWSRLADAWKQTPMGETMSEAFYQRLVERQQAFEGFAQNVIALFRTS
jgi:hypothetical protein